MSFTSSCAEIPSVNSWIPYIGSGLKFTTDADNYIAGCIEEYGSAFTLKMGGKKIHLVTSPHDFPVYYKGAKGLKYDPIQKEIVESTFGIKKKYLQFPASETHGIVYKSMKGDKMDPLVASLQQNISAVLESESHSDWKIVEVHDYIRRLIFHVGMLVIYGQDTYSTSRYKSFLRLDEAFPLLVGGIPSCLIKGVNKARRLIGDGLERSSNGASDTSKSTLKYFKSLGLDKKIVERMQGVFLWGAQANTNISSAWVAYYIFRDKQLLQRIRAEVDAVYANVKLQDECVYSVSSLSKMTLLESCIWEGLRLCNSIMSMRACDEDSTVTLHDGRELLIKAGEYFSMYSRASHMDESIYENPTEFIPERFVDKSKKFSKDGKTLVDNVSIFSGGEAICPGRFFAISEMKIILAEFIRCFDIEMDEQPALKMNYSRSGMGTLCPDGKAYFRYKRRVFDD